MENKKRLIIKIKGSCIICDNPLPEKLILNYHPECIKGNPQKKIKNCCICNRTLPPKAIFNYHKKCKNSNLDVSQCNNSKYIVTISDDKEECTVQY